MHREDVSIRIAMMNTEENSWFLFSVRTLVMTWKESYCLLILNRWKILYTRRNRSAANPERDRMGRMVHDPLEGEKKSQDSPSFSDLGIKQVRRPDPEGIFNAEHCDGQVFACDEDALIGPAGLKRFKKQAENVDEDGGSDEIVEPSAETVGSYSDLNDVEHAPGRGIRSENAGACTAEKSKNTIMSM